MRVTDRSDKTVSSSGGRNEQGKQRTLQVQQQAWLEQTAAAALTHWRLMDFSNSLSWGGSWLFFKKGHRGSNSNTVHV